MDSSCCLATYGINIVAWVKSLRRNVAMNWPHPLFPQRRLIYVFRLWDRDWDPKTALQNNRDFETLAWGLAPWWEMVEKRLTSSGLERRRGTPFPSPMPLPVRFTRRILNPPPPRSMVPAGETLRTVRKRLCGLLNFARYLFLFKDLLPTLVTWKAGI